MNNLYLHPAAVKRIKEIEAATQTTATMADGVVQLIPVLPLQDGESVAEFHVRDNRSIEWFHDEAKALGIRDKFFWCAWRTDNHLPHEICSCRCHENQKNSGLAIGKVVEKIVLPWESDEVNFSQTLQLEVGFDEPDWVLFFNDAGETCLTMGLADAVEFGLVDGQSVAVELKGESDESTN